MIDADGDGYRETPSGKQFQFQIWISTTAGGDVVALVELLREYWTEIGLHVDINPSESIYLSNATSANEVPVRTINPHTVILWFFQDWANVCWGPLWSSWKNTSGLNGAVDGDYLEPPQEVKDFYLGVDSLTVSSADVAMSETLLIYRLWCSRLRASTAVPFVNGLVFCLYWVNLYN